MADPVMSGFTVDGTYFPPGLFRFSHYWQGCPVFVPRLDELEPHPTPFTTLMMTLELPKEPAVDWLDGA